MEFEVSNSLPSIVVAGLRLMAVACLSASIFAGSATAGAMKTAVFDFDLIDDSQEGEANGVRADETARLALISQEMRRLLKEDGRFEAVDLAPLAARIDQARPMYKCNHCEDALAKAAGADFAIICTVQKVSNLILNINVYVRDVKAEKIVRAMSSDIRSNSDESWLRGLRYLVKNQLLADKQPGQM